MKCDICGKESKNVKLHKRLAHPEPEEKTESAYPMVLELQQQIAQLKGVIENNKAVGKSAEDIAKILYEDIVKPLGEEHGFRVQEWGAFDPAGYLKVARRIKG